jgi:hypothetical protein
MPMDETLKSLLLATADHAYEIHDDAMALLLNKIADGSIEALVLLATPSHVMRFGFGDHYYAFDLERIADPDG